MATQREQILAYLRSADGPRTTAEIAIALGGVDRKRASQLCGWLREEGLLEHVDGQAGHNYRRWRMVDDLPAGANVRRFA